MPSPSSPPRVRRVSLQRRDLQLMEALVQLRAETLDELHAQFFTGLSRKRAVNRLAQLARAGYLQPADVILFGEERATRVYTLGPKARAALELRSLCSEHFRFRRWNPTLRDASIPHQVVVNRLGRELGIPLVPEHLLPVVDRNGARNRPDAVVEGVDRHGECVQLGFEVDLGHYSRERILGKLKAWRAIPDRGYLVFIVPDDTRAQKLQSWLDDQRGAIVHTRQSFTDEITRAQTDAGEGICFRLDLWAGGKAWAAEHERERQRQARFDRKFAEEQRLAEQEHEERQERERQARLAQERAAIDQANRNRGRRRRRA